MDHFRDSVRKFLEELPGQKSKADNQVKNLRTYHPSLFENAYEVVERKLIEGKSVMEDVWDLLIKESDGLPLSQGVVRKWQLAIEALLPYAINLYLAPNRPEFKHVKVGIIPKCVLLNLRANIGV